MSIYSRSIAQFQGLSGVAMGLVLGLITSCAVESPDVAQSAQEVSDLAPARLVMDRRQSIDDVQTGTVCAHGPYRCFAHVQATDTGAVRTFAAPAGIGPLDLQAAYKIPTTVSGTPTIAIIDAYGYPALESD